MGILNELNFDEIAKYILRVISIAIEGWLHGTPTSESALTNRITEVLNIRRYPCNVAYNKDATFTLNHFLLDRRAPDNTDMYGADLAVTVEVVTPFEHLVKTALIQIKISNHNKVELEERQLMDSLINSITADRAFVAAVDVGMMGVIRICPTHELRTSFLPGKKTHVYNTSEWATLIQWLEDWLVCNLGVLSDPDDSRSIESILTRFTDTRNAVTTADILRQYELPRIPARDWVRYKYAIPGDDNYLDDLR